MTLQTLGTAAATSLHCLPQWSQVLAAADIAAIGQTIADDRQFGSILGGYSGGATAMIGTGDTHTNTTLDNVARVSGAALAQIQVGDLVLGEGIAPATFVQAVAGGGATITLSQAATATAVGANVAFARLAATSAGVGGGGLGPAAGEVYVPNRGVLKVLPGDVVAIDPITGWPILVSKNAIDTAGSVWTLT